MAALTKRLIKHGNSLALVIDKPILELLQVDPETPLEVTTNGDAILVVPVRDKARQARLRASLERLNARSPDEAKRATK
ncbi:MAG: AbrB/MazE/SpoVT family DNA-binding domain-containing protein [Planctomycetota bacterium]|nr:AbrB/MazE/SpoVT family DNA-binding domain-containing protein [Planctomycetota bacterium]